MGAQTSSLSRRIRQLLGPKARKFLLVGLDAAGKTTLLYKLKLGEVVTSIPTIGFNVETLDFVSNGQVVNLTSWDTGGRSPLRVLWRHYHQDTSAIMYVVDANDRDRIEQAKDELQRMLAEDLLAGVPLLVFANKQDLPRAMSKSEIAEGLGLGTVHDRHWFVQESAFMLGKGVEEGLGWLNWALEPNNKLRMQTKCPGDVQDADKHGSANDKVSSIPTGDEPVEHVHV